MTAQGYRNRIYAIEWLGNLWLRYGAPRDVCERMIAHCSENVSADYYGEPRLIADDPEIARAQAHFDRMFSQDNGVVSFA